MGGAPDPLAVLVVPDAFSVLVISAVLYLSVQLVCIARSRACCIANAGAGAWAQVVNMGFNLDAALASGSTSGAQLQARHSVQAGAEPRLAAVRRLDDVGARRHLDVPPLPPARRVVRGEAHAALISPSSRRHLATISP